MALEMCWMLKFSKTRVPSRKQLWFVGFPSSCRAGSFTTLLSLRAEYASINIILALVNKYDLGIIVVSMTDQVQKLFGKGGIYIIRKFFGVYPHRHCSKIVYSQYYFAD